MSYMHQPDKYWTVLQSHPQYVRPTTDYPLDRMPHRMSSSPLNLEAEMLREVVLAIEPRSSTHVARIIYDEVKDNDHHYDAELFKLITEYNRDRRCGVAGAEDKLRAFIQEARDKWAIVLRNSGRRDLNVIIAHESFGNGRNHSNEARYVALREDLTKAGGEVYFKLPFNKELDCTKIGVVIPAANIDGVLTKKRMATDALFIEDNTDPALTTRRQPDPNPGCMFWYRDDDGKVQIVPTHDETRCLTNTLQDVLAKVPITASWHPYPSSNFPMEPKWPDRRPVMVPEPDDWVKIDEEERRAELEQYRIDLSSHQKDDIALLAELDQAIEDMSVADPPRDTLPDDDDDDDEVGYLGLSLDDMARDVVAPKPEQKAAEEKEQQASAVLRACRAQGLPADHPVMKFYKKQSKEATQEKKICQSMNGSTIWEEPVHDSGVCFEENEDVSGTGKVANSLRALLKATGVR